jgi:hypothetical protein
MPGFGWRSIGALKAKTGNNVPQVAAKRSRGVVDRYGFFENQLVGGTYMTFDETISGVRVQSICTNFDGIPTFGSYIKINGTVVASDWTIAPDGTNNSANVGTRMTRGHTVVILNASGVVQSTTVYDTWNGDGEACVPMAAALKAVPAGYIVGIGTYDATSCLQVLRDAFTNYFNATTYTNVWNPQRRSQMFLAKRNSTP